MFQVHDIPTGSSQIVEPLGTKYKFWYRDPAFGLTLFKEGRPGTGENWAERIACELAMLLQLPHATYHFATYEGRQGVISPSLVERGARIVHGNELLESLSTGYEQGERYRNPNHTLRRVFAYLKRSSELLGAPYDWKQTTSIRTAVDFFIGYLMFDTWIANQDRHDENWGVLRTNEGNLFLAPSFDHGSSMARNESDQTRLLRLTTKDLPRHISAYVKSARSGFFPSGTEPRPKPLYTLEAFVQGASQNRLAAAEWRERLQAIDLVQVRDAIEKVPAEWMSIPARDFTVELLRLNRERILTEKLP
jgi:hypothetical protein